MPLSAADWQGRYVRVAGLKPGEKIDLIFPQRDLVEDVEIAWDVWTITWRGDTVGAMSPHGTIHPFCDRRQLRNRTTAPMKAITYHVPYVEVPW